MAEKWRSSLRRWPHRLLAAVVTVAMLATCLLSAPRTVAQQLPGGGSGSELMQVFQSLTPDQQDAIMKQLGGGGGAGGLGALLGGGNSKGKVDREGTLNRQLSQQQSEAAPTEEEAEAALPGFKSEDWLVIQANVPEAPPVAPPQPSPTPTLPAGVPGSPTSNTLASLLAASAANQQPPVAAARAPTEQLSDEQSKRLHALADLIRSQNPYQLSQDGALTLPGFPPIALLGLSDDQATLRLQVEPALRGLSLHLTRLTLRKTGVAALKPFGYDIFGGRAPSTFAPVSDVPVPANYVVGPGDELDVELYGKMNRSLRLRVARDGHVDLPDIGPVNVAGQPFTSVKSGLEARIQNQMIGVRASVSMGDTRGLQVFVAGAVRRPGSYVLSGFGTMTAALYAAGGMKPIGSLRDVQLKRRGVLVQHLDLYDLLIHGSNADDAKLVDGDVIFVPPVGPTASVTGEVKRPATYELKGEATAADLLQLAGGLTPDADSAKAMLTGFDAMHRRVVLAVDLGASARSQVLHNGDLLSVARTRPTLDAGVLVQGYVYAPGVFAWRQGIRLSEVIRSVDDLRPNADLHYLLIRRELTPNRQITVLSADLTAALAAPGTPADVELMPRDRITVFDLASGRDPVLQPVLDELRLQGNAGTPSQVVQVDGHVRVPGSYPLEPGMTVSDLIRAGGGTTEDAYSGHAELVRYSVDNGSARRTQLLDVDLAAALRGDPAANLRLQAFDTLSVKEMPEWGSHESVTLRGEVRFPGSYAIRRGETLKSVIGRAGGLTSYAFVEGSVFTREELKVREQEQIDMLADRMQRDVALLALQSAAANQAGAATALSVGQSLLGQLKGAHAVGRLVIDLPHLTTAPVGSTYDVVLRGGDTLSVPRFEQQVTVIGEVQNTTSHLFNPKLVRDDYVALSGGLTRRADRSKIYIVRANGSVIATEGSRWFERSSRVTIKPGDTIVVPLDTEHIPALPLWTQVTQILYNLAVAVLAIRSL